MHPFRVPHFETKIPANPITACNTQRRQRSIFRIVPCRKDFGDSKPEIHKCTGLGMLVIKISNMVPIIHNPIKTTCLFCTDFASLQQATIWIFTPTSVRLFTQKQLYIYNRNFQTLAGCHLTARRNVWHTEDGTEYLYIHIRLMGYQKRQNVLQTQCCLDMFKFNQLLQHFFFS